MKKYLCLFLGAVFVFALAGCTPWNFELGSTDSRHEETTEIEPEGTSQPLDVDAVFDTNGVFEYVNNNGLYTLYLPNAQDDVTIFLNDHDDCLNNLSKIDETLFMTALKKIYSNAENAMYAPHLEIVVFSDGYLMLSGEIIVKLDPPKGNSEYVEQGCGIDHDHVFFNERISLEPIYS